MQKCVSLHLQPAEDVEQQPAATGPKYGTCSRNLSGAKNMEMTVCFRKICVSS